MANYVKFKQGLKKDFNTTNQPLTNGMIYFVIDENNNGSIYYDTIVDGAQATKKGTVHRVKFSGLPIKITGSVTGTGVIKDGELIEINTSTNHSHGLAHQDFTVTLSNDDTNLKWTRLGNQNGEGFWLKSIKGDVKAPAWFQPNHGAGVAFGGGSTKGIISVKYNEPSIRFAGGNGDAPVWYFTITGANNKTYDLSKIGGHSSDSAKLDHNVTFKIASTANATKGGSGTVTDLSGPAVDLYLPTKMSGFDLLQATRFQGTADNADTVDYFHVAEEKYKYETTKKQPTSGANWCIKISTPVWNANSETIYLTAFGSNSWGTIILKTGSRQYNWWGYATSYNGTGIIGVYKIISDSDDVYIKVNGAYTSVRIRTTFDPTISIPTTIPDYKFTSVPLQGGFFSNAIYTDTLTFTTPKYWANIPISDNLKTDTQPTFNTAYVSNWWRSTGNTGWWNETHQGGITMENDTYVKVAGNKSFLIPKGSLKIGGNGDIFFATGNDDATLKIYGQTNTKYGIETIAIQTCFDNQDPEISKYTTSYADRCNLLLQPRGGQVYIGKNLTTVGDTGYKLFVDGSQWTSGSQWVNGNLLFTDITGNTADIGMSLKGIYGRIGGNNGWRIAGGARAKNAGYLEIATCDDMNEPIYVRQYGGGGDWIGYGYLVRTFTLLDAAGRSRAPELFEAKKVHVNSKLDQSVAIADTGYQFQVTGTSNFTDNVNISGVTTHHNNIQMDVNSTTWLIGHRGANGANSGSGNANGANLTGKINDLTIEVNGSSGQGLTLPATQGELLTWQQRPIMAQLPAQGNSATILNNANYKTAYLATTNNGNISMGLIAADWYHVMNFRHLDNNGYNSQFVLPLDHNGQAAWRLSIGTTWKPWNYIFDNNHAMVPASNNVYNIGSTSNYWATGYINTLYVAGNAYANGSKRIPTTGNTTGTIGSATVPVYSDNGVLKTITSYSGNAATATVASSANKLNTSAGGNTNPIYFTNGVPVRSTASVGSANQPVYLNNGVITACAGSQSGTEKQQSFKISGSNGTAHWYYLGHLTSNGDNSEVIIDIYSGNGYNGTGDQNTHISIFVKDGWQSTKAAENSFGISYLVDHSDVNATSIRVKGLASADNIIDLYIYLPWGYSDGYYSIKGYYNTWAHKGTRSTAEPTSGEVQNCVFGAFRAGQVYGAVWNDYAEYRRTKKYIQPGYCVIETGKGDLIKSSKRLQPGANIVSDTFGFAIGETEQTKTPLAVSGRVLAYPYEDRDSYQAGDPVCSGPNGTISKMTREEVREYPDRIIGTVSEIPNYEVWGTGNVKVNNRIWIKVK